MTCRRTNLNQTKEETVRVRIAEFESKRAG